MAYHITPRMSLFPQGAKDYEEPTPQSRNAAMAALLGAMLDAPQESNRLLAEANDLLLSPFFGVPDEGSIYGAATSTLEERVVSYEAAMQDRISRTRRAGSVEQADALQCMLSHVLDKLGYEQTSDDVDPGGAAMSSDIESKLQAAIDSDTDPEFDIIA